MSDCKVMSPERYRALQGAEKRVAELEKVREFADSLLPAMDRQAELIESLETRADAAEKRVEELEAALAPILADVVHLNTDIENLCVKRTNRDSNANRTMNAWKTTIIELIGPRTKRAAASLLALLHPATTTDDGDAEPSDDDNERDRMIQESIDAAQDPEYLARMADYGDADRAVDEGGA